MVTRVSKGGKDTPDLALTDRQAFNNLNDELWTARRINDAQAQDMGFPGVRYNGVMVIWTDNTNIISPTNANSALFVLNTNYLYLICHSQNWMNMTAGIRAPDKLAVYTQIECMGNLVCSQRARQGLIVAIDSNRQTHQTHPCLLYTSDAADE